MAVIDPGVIGAIAGGVVAGAAGVGAVGWKMLKDSDSNTNTRTGHTEHQLEEIVKRAMNGLRDDVRDIKRAVQHSDYGNVALHQRLISLQARMDSNNLPPAA